MLKKFVILLIVLASTFSGFAQSNATQKQNSLTVFLVRHAEKVDSSHDAELSESGKQRAIELAETLKSAELEYIHSTDYIRTKNTATPTADLFKLKVKMYSPYNLAGFAQELQNQGGRHLVVGHSNTTPKLLELLGGEPGAPIVEKNEYDRLYIVSIQGGQVNTVLLRYGKSANIK